MDRAVRFDLEFHTFDPLAVGLVGTCRFQEYYILEPYNVNPWITVWLSTDDKAWLASEGWEHLGLVGEYHS